MVDEAESVRDEPVTVVVARRPKKGKEAEMEAFLTGITRDTAGFPGYLGTSLLYPTKADDPEYRAIVKFDSERHYQEWERSELRSEWLKIGDAITQDPPQIKVLTGLETWFSLPGAGAVAPPPKHKMMVVAWMAIYPLSMLVNWIMAPYLVGWTIPARSLVFSLILTPVMTYFAVPYVSRLFSKWLYPGLSER